MKIKCNIDGEIYKVIEESRFEYKVNGIYTGFPVWIPKSECEVIDEQKEK